MPLSAELILWMTRHLEQHGTKSGGSVRAHLDPHTARKWGGQDPQDPTGSPPLRASRQRGARKWLTCLLLKNILWLSGMRVCTTEPLKRRINITCDEKRLPASQRRITNPRSRATNVITVNNARRRSDDAYLRLVNRTQTYTAFWLYSGDATLFARALSPDSTISIGSFAWPQSNDFARKAINRCAFV